MKKEYKTPTMKVRTINCSHMLCGSPECMQINATRSAGYEDYGAW